MQRRQFFKISAGVAFSLSSIPMTAIAAGNSDIRTNVWFLEAAWPACVQQSLQNKAEPQKFYWLKKADF